MTKVKETSTNFENKMALADECSEVYAANIIGGQWSLVICSWLLHGRMRFGELKQSIPNITERMLSLQLRKLEKDSILMRQVYAEILPRVEYELTEIGNQLRPIIQQLEEWRKRHKLVVKDAS